MSRPKSSLLIIGYYHLADGFRTCANFLERDYEIFFFPLCHYHDFQYPIQKELSQYIRGAKCEHYECGLKPTPRPIDIVLLWNINYFIENHERLNMWVKICHENHRPVYLGFNWDPIPPKMDLNPFKLALIQTLTCYLSGDGLELKRLRQKGLYNHEYCQSGYDPQITYYTHDPIYECDVSIVCTNLYTDTDLFPRELVRVHRKDLVDLLYQHRSELTFHIYGPPSFKDLYPDCYRGYIKYNDCPHVFSNSRLNLCIHATSSNNDQSNIYFSERLPQIMGSRGLLYCETDYSSSGLLIPNVNYILADSNHPFEQIKGILHDYHNRKYQRIKEKGYELAVHCLTWNMMRTTINHVIHQSGKIS